MRKTFNPTDDTRVYVKVTEYNPAGEGRIRWQYTLCSNDQCLFHGDDFSSPHFWSEEQVLYSLLGFLTLKPGDTDAEYFATYTPDQLEWANDCACEALAMEVQNHEN